MLTGALIGAVVGVIVVLIQNARKKKMRQDETLDTDMKKDNVGEEV